VSSAPCSTVGPGQVNDVIFSQWQASKWHHPLTGDQNLRLVDLQLI